MAYETNWNKRKFIAINSVHFPQSTKFFSDKRIKRLLCVGISDLISLSVFYGVIFALILTLIMSNILLAKP